MAKKHEGVVSSAEKMCSQLTGVARSFGNAAVRQIKTDLNNYESLCKRGNVSPQTELALIHRILDTYKELEKITNRQLCQRSIKIEYR